MKTKIGFKNKRWHGKSKIMYINWNVAKDKGRDVILREMEKLYS